MKNELSKRIITSVLLISLFILTFFYTFILIILLIVFSIVVWVEFNGLILKIFLENNFYTKLIIFGIKLIILFYLLLFAIFVFDGISNNVFQVESKSKLDITYLFCICIFSDIGGLVFGKIFKGKKLTKISPNKTISGSLGSFILALSLVPFFYFFFEQLNNFFNLLIISILVSLVCQLGDLFISYLKRKAKVKDTGDLLPGHGGVLDRFDGILFAVPFGVILIKIL